MGEYLITGKGDGHCYGIYPGDTPEDAVFNMFSDAGSAHEKIDMSKWLVNEVDPPTAQAYPFD